MIRRENYGNESSACDQIRFSSWADEWRLVALTTLSSGWRESKDLLWNLPASVLIEAGRSRDAIDSLARSTAYEIQIPFFWYEAHWYSQVSPIHRLGDVHRNS